MSLAPLGQVRKIARDGSESTLATLIPPTSAPGVLGLAVDAPGNVYAAVSTFDPATSGVYRIARDGSFVRLPGTEAIVFPNGVTLDQRGNIYVTDTILGAVWRVPAGGGPAEPWFQSPLLLGSGIFEFGFRLARTGSPSARTSSSSPTRKVGGCFGSASTRTELRGPPRCSQKARPSLPSTGSPSTCMATSGRRSSRKARSSACPRAAPSRPWPRPRTDSIGRPASRSAKTTTCGPSTSRSVRRAGLDPRSFASRSE